MEDRRGRLATVFMLMLTRPGDWLTFADHPDQGQRRRP